MVVAHPNDDAIACFGFAIDLCLCFGNRSIYLYFVLITNNCWKCYLKTGTG